MIDQEELYKYGITVSCPDSSVLDEFEDFLLDSRNYAEFEHTRKDDTITITGNICDISHMLNRIVNYAKLPKICKYTNGLDDFVMPDSDRDIITFGNVSVGVVPKSATVIDKPLIKMMGCMRNLHTQSIMNCIHKYINKTSYIVDLGSGKGVLDLFCKACGADTVIGIEYNKNTYDISLETAKNNPDLNVTFINDDFYNYIKIIDTPVDIFIIDQSIDDIAATLPLIKDKLSEAGVVVLCGWGKTVTIDEVKSIIENNEYEVVEISEYYNIPTIVCKPKRI